MIRGSTRLLGILGNPLAHSYSPALHNAAIRSLGLDLAYLPFPVTKDGLTPLLAGLKSAGFLGVNVTMPYKADVIPLLDEVSDLSRTLGAVNTIIHRDGRLVGTTTDPEGFLAGFAADGRSFDGRAVAILGSGGSARTIVFTLALMTGARRVAIVARSPEKASALLAEVRAAAPGRDIATVDLEAYRASAAVRAHYDVVVNTTPLGMHPDTEASPLPADAFEEGQIVYDLLYNPEETRLMRDARARGCPVVGGLGMLVGQGVASFRLWTGLSPDPEACHAGIRAQREADARGASPHGGKPA